jgi:cation transport ATPase
MRWGAESVDPVIEVTLYAVVIVPAVLFVLLYLIVWSRIRHTEEAWHLLLFTATLAVIAIETAARNIWHLWDRSDLLFSALMLLAGSLLWQRLYMLLRNTVLPALRGRREPRHSRRSR